MKILVTGAAGFIGFHLVKCLVENDIQVIGLDSINDYYDIKLKYARLKETGIEENIIEENELIQSSRFSNYKFIKLKLEDKLFLNNLFENERFDIVCNLAAQAGVRNSINNPNVYVESNVFGFTNLLECCRHFSIKHLIYASSSSVYGQNTKVPFSEDDRVDTPISLYAVTKRFNELLSYSYSHLYQIRVTGLRFFTVYGPWGRPDMAPMLFTKAILKKDSINVFNNGELSRDFTYIDDIVDGIVKVIQSEKKDNVLSKIYNIGCSNPIQLIDFISILEETIGIKSKKKMLPMQQGDVYHTYADTTKIESDFGYKPQTTLKVGIKKFVHWYINFYKEL